MNCHYYLSRNQTVGGNCKPTGFSSKTLLTCGKYEIYVYKGKTVCLFVCVCVCVCVCVSLQNGESDRQGMQSAYSVHHGKETDRTGFDFPLVSL